MTHTEALHAEDIGFVLRAGNTSTHSQGFSITYCVYCYDFLLSTVVTGGIVVVSEYLAQFIHIGKNTAVYWFNAPGLIPIFGMYLVFLCTHVIFMMCKRKVGFIYAMFYNYTHSLLFLLLIYHYALPTFLLMFVYPTKVNAIVAFLIAFVYISITVSSIAILMFIKMMKWLNNKKIRTCMKLSGRVYLSYLILFAIIVPLLLFALILVLYVVLLNQSFSITSAPVYTVLSFIPTAAISFIICRT